MMPPTLNDTRAHRAHEPPTRTTEESARAPPCSTKPLSPPCLFAFTPAIKLAELRADTLALGTQLHGTPPSASFAAWTPTA